MRSKHRAGQAKTSATPYRVFETTVDGAVSFVLETTDRKLAQAVAAKGNKMRRPGETFPHYDVRLVLQRAPVTT